MGWKRHEAEDRSLAHRILRDGSKLPQPLPHSRKLPRLQRRPQLPRLLRLPQLLRLLLRRGGLSSRTTRAC
jgi:hypothetical protein